MCCTIITPKVMAAQDVAKTISTQLASAPQEVAQACFLPVITCALEDYDLSEPAELTRHLCMNTQSNQIPLVLQVSPDGKPLIGAIPGVKGAYIAAGCANLLAGVQ